MKKTVGMLLLSAALIASNLAVTNQSIAKTIKLCDGFAPPNDLKIPYVKGMVMEGMDEATFNRAIDDFEKVFIPIVKNHGAALKIARKWTDATVNSDTTESGKTWTINAYGGLARFKGMNYDGYLAVLGHELGHHLGGYPKIGGIFGASWASNEGQSDYYATMKALRMLFKDVDNSTIVSTMSIPALVTDQCALQHKSESEIALCKRSSMAGLLLAGVLNDLGRGSSPVK